MKSYFSNLESKRVNKENKIYFEKKNPLVQTPRSCQDQNMSCILSPFSDKSITETFYHCCEVSCSLLVSSKEGKSVEAAELFTDSKIVSHSKLLEKSK